MMKKLVLLIAAMLLIGGCATTTPAPDSGTKSQPNLKGTIWVLQQIDGKRVHYAIVGGEIFGESALSFGDGVLSGNTGANQFKASYQTKNGHLTIEQMMATKAMAFHKQLADNEAAIFEVLGAPEKSYDVTGNILTIVSANASLAYAKFNPFAYTTWVLWEKNGKQPDQKGLTRPPLLEFDATTMTGFLGAQMFTATYEPEGEKVDVTNIQKIGTVEANSPEAASLENSVVSVLSSTPAATFPTPTRMVLGDENSNLTFMRATLARPIINSRWELVDINGAPTFAKKPTLEFRDESVFGNGGVNTFNGKFAIEDRKLYVTPLAQTMMAGKIEAMEQEKRYIDILQNAVSFKFVDYNTLQIFATNDVLTLRRVSK
jgi:heat shock protein HslJ